jgi:tripartite-type tricarboxylate transporter receptor subunit TctC
MRARILLLCVAALFGFSAHGQDRTLKIQIPFAPGGGTDILGRIIAPRLAERLGQPVIVENRPGAAGAIAARYTAQSTPDGLTLMIGSISEIGINPSVNPKLGYDVWRDFVALAPLASTPMILVAHPAVPANTPKEVIALAAARPGQINYGSAGAGSGAHMGAELFRYLTKVDLAHVPYKGTGAAVADLAGGQVQLVFTTLPSAVALVKGGKLKAIAVASAQRVPTLPEVPTFVESGVPEYRMDYWYGFFAPAATPRDIQARLTAATREVLRMPDVVAGFDKSGLLPMGGTAEEFAAFVRSDMDRWAKVVKAAGIKVD